MEDDDDDDEDSKSRIKKNMILCREFKQNTTLAKWILLCYIFLCGRERYETHYYYNNQSITVVTYYKTANQKATARVRLSNPQTEREHVR